MIALRCALHSLIFRNRDIYFLKCQANKLLSGNKSKKAMMALNRSPKQRLAVKMIASQ